MLPAQLLPWILWGAFILSFVFAVLAQRSNFCTLGAIADGVNYGDWDRLRAWVLATLVALLGTNILYMMGWIDITQSIYLGRSLIPLSNIMGGVLFGLGMVLAGGCGSKTLLRMGAGSLKSTVVFLMLGLSAYATLRGITAVVRVNTVDRMRWELPIVQGIPDILAWFFGGDTVIWRITSLILLAFGGLWFVWQSRTFRSLQAFFPPFLIGAMVVMGWYLTGNIGFLPEHPETLEPAFVGTNSGRLESLTFVAPLAYTLELFLLWSDKSRVVSFGIASVGGVLVGSWLWSVLKGSFRWEGFHDVEDMFNHLIGGILMGIGGVTALGCTIGQGVSGISTLSLGSFIAVLGIFLGAKLGLIYQIWRIGHIE